MVAAPESVAVLTGADEGDDDVGVDVDCVGAAAGFDADGPGDAVGMDCDFSVAILSRMLLLNIGFFLVFCLSWSTACCVDNSFSSSLFLVVWVFCVTSLSNGSSLSGNDDDGRVGTRGGLEATTFVAPGVNGPVFTGVTSDCFCVATLFSAALSAARFSSSCWSK